MSATSSDSDEFIVCRREKQIAKTESFLRRVMLSVLNLNATPTERTLAYSMIQTMFRTNPERFTIISGIHQNNKADPIHFSVQVEIGNGFHQRLHFNLYQVNTEMKCYSIEGFANNTISGTRFQETIAVFYL
jgi:hypothetical protein